MQNANCMIDYKKILSGGDLRSTGQSDILAQTIFDQESFDRLFTLLFDDNRIIVMRAVDAIEKITLHHPEFLTTHKKEIIHLSESAFNKELVWHLALLIPRLQLTDKDFHKEYRIIKSWATNSNNSRIVRVNAVQALFEMIQQNNNLQKDFSQVLAAIQRENIPSINARIKKIRARLATG